MHFTQPEIRQLLVQYSGWTNWENTLRRVCEDILTLHQQLEQTQAKILALQAERELPLALERTEVSWPS